MMVRLSIQLRVCGDLTTERHPVVIASPGHLACKVLIHLAKRCYEQTPAPSGDLRRNLSTRFRRSFRSSYVSKEISSGALIEEPQCCGYHR